VTDYMISQLPTVGSLATNDLIVVVDVSDTSTPPAGAGGSDKKAPLSQLAELYLAITGGAMSGFLAPSVTTLTFGSSIAINAALGNVFAVTLTASTGTLANPTNATQDGQPIRVRVIQGGSGNYTLAYGSAWDFGAAGTPTLSTTAGDCDYIVGEWNEAKAKWCVSFAGGY
jgi:hypothetical protein